MNSEKYELPIYGCQKHVMISSSLLFFTVRRHMSDHPTGTKDLILAIDNGTQSVRALLFDLEGTLLAKARVPIDTYSSYAPGISEQDPQVFWQSLCQACQGLWATMEKSQTPHLVKERIAGVALTTQRSTVINLDKEGQPLRPAITWMDQRRTEGLPPVGGVWGLAFKLSGMTNTVAYLQAEAEANWIRINQPEIWAQTHKYLLLSGYLTYRLTGKYIDSTGCQPAYIPFDYKNQAWSKRFDWKWQAVPMKRRSCRIWFLPAPCWVKSHAMQPSKPASPPDYH